MHWRRKWQPIPVFLPGKSQGEEAWLAAVYGVAQSRTRLKRRSSSSSSSILFKMFKYIYLCRRRISPMEYCSTSTLLWRKQWHPTPVLLPGKSMDGGAWWAAVHGVAIVGHDWATSLSLFTFMHWRRKWQPTPVFLPGESQGERGLVGCRLWGRTESDMTEVT